MELILVRHGLPIRKATDDGSPADPPLSEIGRAQADAVAEWLASERVDRVYSSHLLRARQTAMPLCERIGVELEIEARVAEYDQHSETYVPLEELRDQDYEAWREFMARGYPEGMDLEEFRHAVVTACDELVKGNGGKRVAVFCHGGVINTWASHVLGLGLKLFFNPGYTSINRFLASGEGIRSIGSLNETPHLRGLS